MERISNTKRGMASLAVFRALYDGKKDIYAIISEFIKLIIINRNITFFELQQMVAWVSEEYGFNLPEAVIKRSISKLDFLNKERTQYIVTTSLDANKCQSIQQSLKEAQDNNTTLTASLLHYAKQKFHGRITNTKQEEELKKAFYSYVIDEKAVPPEYNAIISGFVVSISNNETLKTQLNCVRQGMIIYVGLTYNTDYHVIDEIDVPLYIYLDTEILFSMAGYNGKLYKTLFDEFYELVTQINKHSKKMIHFRYFTETRQEIDGYFAVAENIVCHKQQLDPSKQAMTHIVSSCQSAHQVKEMQADFYEKTKKLNIKLDSQESYYDKENAQFSIEHKTLLNEFSKEYTAEDIYKKLKLLNYINIKRGNKSQKIFRNIGHILVSGNKLTFKLAHHNQIRPTGYVPLATDLDFLTNRFWLSLNKGLGNNMNLHSFDIITKAQIALSTLVNDAVGHYYDELKNEIENGGLDTEELKRKIASLRQLAVKPEEINTVNEDTYINIVGIEEIDFYIAEKYHESEKRREENEKLKEEISQTNQQLRNATQMLANKQNQENKSKFEKDKQEYDIRKKSWVMSNFKKKKQKSLRIALTYTLIIIVLAIATFLFKETKWISATIAFAMLAIPFIRPLVNHAPIKEAYLFLLQKSLRDNYKSQLEERFHQENPVPTLQHITTEEMIKRIRDIQQNS